MNATRVALVPAAALVMAVIAGCSHQHASPTAPGGAVQTPATAHRGTVIDEDFAGLRVFPANDGFNLDASNAPVDSNSQAYINWISGRTAQDSTRVVIMQAYFGPAPQGLPYVGVSGAQPLLPVDFVTYPAESDAGAPGNPPGYPIPDEAKSQSGFIEGNLPGDIPMAEMYGDRHLILVDRDHGLLYELWRARWNATTGHWEAGSGATYNLATGPARPEGWTSTSASGLALWPGLVRYDEACGTGEIRHALLCGTRASTGYVWPATHAGSVVGDAPPLGMRLRLKASVDLSGYPAEMQRIFRAMKTYGVIVSDNGGSEFGLFGTMDERWNNHVLIPAVESLHADDFEVVKLGWGKPGQTAR